MGLHIRVRRGVVGQHEGHGPGRLRDRHHRDRVRLLRICCFPSGVQVLGDIPHASEDVRQHDRGRAACCHPIEIVERDLHIELVPRLGRVVVARLVGDVHHNLIGGNGAGGGRRGGDGHCGDHHHEERDQPGWKAHSSGSPITCASPLEMRPIAARSNAQGRTSHAVPTNLRNAQTIRASRNRGLQLSSNRAQW